MCRHLKLCCSKIKTAPDPFHSKPIGEHSAVPTAPCIANALYDAIGKQITDLPLSAEFVYDAIKNLRGEREIR